ncbi:Uncharacterised protein [Mycobacteroides abscessus subsp. abscessus]|nr:Uncharacterised protein [Mycobacteroides abscessus subsp. abscessus]
MVAAAGASVAAVEIERLRAKPGVACVLVERVEQLGLLGEAARRLNVDLDDTRVRCDGQRDEAGVRGGSVALDDHRCVDLGGRVLDHLDDRQILLELCRRR